MNDDEKPNKNNVNPNQGDGKQPPQGGFRFNRNLLPWLVLIGLAVVLLVVIQSNQDSAKQITYGELKQSIIDNKVEEIIINNDRLEVVYKPEAAADAAGTEGDQESKPKSDKENKAFVQTAPSTRAWYVEQLQEGITNPEPVMQSVMVEKKNDKGEVVLDAETNKPVMVSQEKPREDANGQPIMRNVLYEDYTVKEVYNDQFWIMIAINILPWLLIIAVVWFFIIRAMRSNGGGMGMLGSFGRSRHRMVNKEMTNITFADVAGIEEAKDEVTEMVEFLKNPRKFARLGGRVPRGVLLIGSPGCGKTLLAKAVAGEAEVPFFSISGSDFVEMFVGVGASRVRDLFKQAKDSSPCIIFLDEIDAVGRKRSTGQTSGGHDEREQTLNAILVEMDGFETDDQVIVMAATNRSDVLDPALTRPGRFDRQITVPMPDIVGRRKILDVHNRKIKAGPDIDLDRLARQTPMFSGADLEALINEAAIIATLAGKDFVEMEDMEEARDKVRFGRESRSRKVDEEEKIATAYHEAGHAVVQYLEKDADPLHKVTIIPRGQAMGATMSLPEKDRFGYGRNYMLAQMRVLCGGRIAEERKTSDISSGASMDIKMVTNLARHMVLEWGMSERLGFVAYGNPDDPYGFDKGFSDETAKIIDEEIRRLSDDAYKQCRMIIDTQWDKVVGIAEALLKYETLDYKECDRIMKGEQLNKPTVRDLLQAEAAKNRPSTETPPSSPSEPKLDGPDTGGPMPSPA